MRKRTALFVHRQQQTELLVYNLAIGNSAPAKPRSKYFGRRALTVGTRVVDSYMRRHVRKQGRPRANLQQADTHKKKTPHALSYS